MAQLGKPYLTFTFSGVPSLVARMKALPMKIRLTAAKKAMKAGALQIAAQAKENAYRIDDPHTAENIAANVAVQFSSKEFARTGKVVYRVGILGGAKAGAERIAYARLKLTGKMSELPGGWTWYWRFVEFGVPHYGIPARPFLRPALDQAGPAAAEEVARVMDKELDRLVGPNPSGSMLPPRPENL